MDPLFSRIWNERQRERGEHWPSPTYRETANPLFERFAAEPGARLLLDGHGGRHSTGQELAGFAQLVAREVSTTGAVAVLCGDRFVHAVATAAALAAGKCVLPLEPSAPSWLLRRTLRRIAGLGVPTVFVDETTGGGRATFNGACVRDTADYLGRRPTGGTVPPPGHLLTVSSEGVDGTPTCDAVALPVLWRAARAMGGRLGLDAPWTTACVTSLATPGTFVGDVLVALANQSVAMILPALQLSESVGSLERISRLGANSFTAPVHALRHIAAQASSTSTNGLRFAVCTTGDPGKRLAVGYAARAGHPLVAGLTSKRRSLWAALASPSDPRTLRTGVGLEPIVASDRRSGLDERRLPLVWSPEDGTAHLRSVEAYGAIDERGTLEVHSLPARRIVDARGEWVDLDAIDEALLALPEVIDSYTLPRSLSWPEDGRLFSVVALAENLGDGSLFAPIATLSPDPSHGFVRAAVVPRRADGDVLEDDARALANQGLQT